VYQQQLQQQQQQADPTDHDRPSVRPSVRILAAAHCQSARVYHSTPVRPLIAASSAAAAAAAVAAGTTRGPRPAA